MSLTVAAEPVPLTTDEHGVVRVAGTRVTLYTIISAYRRGETPETLAEQYPSIPLADLYAVISYYLRYQEDVDAYLAEQVANADRIRAEIEAQLDPEEMRKRLEAR